MCQVSYDECLDFCDRLTEIARQQGILPEGYCFSLPTEAQWELAYSCGKEIVLPDNLEKVAWMDFHDANTGAYPVGQKEPNAWGFHDMLGNVWELCADFYHSHVCMAAIPSTGKRIPAIYQPILVYQSPPSGEECFLSYLIMRKRYLVKDIMLIQEEPVPD